MSFPSSTFWAHQPVHSEERAISLSLKILPYQPRPARNLFQVRNSVRPMHLFGHSFDHDYYFELPSEGERDTQSITRAFLRGDFARMEQQVAWAAGKPGDEDRLLSAQSDTEAYYGRLSKARDFTRRAVDSAVRADSKETAALWQVNAALREAEFGKAAPARQGVTAGMALSEGWEVKVCAAFTLARAGNTPQAQALAESLEKTYPS